MDFKTCLLGVIPPLLAAFAEAKNPVSKEALERRAGKHVAQHVIAKENVKDDFRYDADDARNALIKTVVSVGETAAEVSGIIPTWISVTSAVTALLIDIVPLPVLLLVLLIVTGGSALFGFRYFDSVDYQDEAAVAAGKRSWLCGGERRVDRISCYIKLGNVLLAAMVVAVWLASDAVPKMMHEYLPKAVLFLKGLCS
jgi:hypothetical protein